MSLLGLPLLRAVLVAVLASLTVAEAAVYSPRVLSPHNADTYSLETFAQFHRWRELTGDAKVFEVYQYLVDRRTGLYPLGVPGWEGEARLAEYGAVTDPIKMLNVYPIGHCGTLGPTAAAIMEGMGIGPARTLIIPGWHHVAAEVFYNDSWHYLDLDVRAVFRRADGSLASVAEAIADSSLWAGPNSALFFPLDRLEETRAAYARAPVNHRYGVAAGGHTMDFVLRRGETFTRWWKPQGGRWNHHATYAGSPFPRDVIERVPRGPKSKHETFTVHTHGNGRFVYKPNLTSASVDFEDSVYEARNVRKGPTGLTLSEDGFATFEVRSPYVIVPLVGDMDSAEDDRDASVVTLDATGVRLALSLDNGLTWEEIEVGSGQVDLTRQVSGRYGYLLRLSSGGGEALVSSLEIVTWVQVHPASLPSLRPGRNRMRLVTGDHHGLATRVLAVAPDAASAADLLKHLVEAPTDYDPARRTSRVRGTVVARVPAPPGTRIAWFSAGASFAAQVGAPGRTRNSIAYAVDEPNGFREIYRAEVPEDQSHWHYNVDREIKLDEPVRTLFVRYQGEPALNDLRIYAHCLEMRPRSSASVIVRHTWTENDIRKTREAEVQSGMNYEIEVGAHPEDESIELSLPSAVGR